jgi:hypothetical protein
VSWEQDAELAGTLYRKSKPYTAMLIARCVEPDQGHGGRNASSEAFGKVSLRAFAELAGMGDATAGRYLHTWDAMAQAGIVPARDEMEPGEDVEVPDMKTWTYYYREVNPPKPRAQVTAKDDGIKASDVPDSEVDDFKIELTGNRRIDQFARRVGMSRRIVEGRSNGPAAIAYSRAVECLQEILEGQDTGRNMLHLLDALTELGTAL